jgi:hypothetical protein
MLRIKCLSADEFMRSYNQKKKDTYCKEHHQKELIPSLSLSLSLFLSFFLSLSLSLSFFQKERRTDKKSKNGACGFMNGWPIVKISADFCLLKRVIFLTLNQQFPTLFCSRTTPKNTNSDHPSEC